MKRISLIIVLALLLLPNVVQASTMIALMSSDVICSDCYHCSQVRASHILVKSKEESLKIKKEIISGKSFEQAASEYSICPSGLEGGDLGWFSRGMMVPEFEDTAFSLPVGQLSDPVRTEFGWHLIMVKAKK